MAGSKGGKPNWDNRTLFHHDNLAVLRGMNSESVDLIATDPPFNKSKDFHATPDSLAKGAKFQDRWSWKKDVHEEWTDQITDDYPRLMEAIESARYAHSDGMGAFMCFMAVRLLEMRRVLKPTGSIYLHCDPTASHYLKAVMDAIFGWRGFRNEIIWRRSAAHNAADRFGPNHDVILFYAMPDYTHVVQFSPYLIGYVEEYFTKSDDRGRYREQELHGSGIRGGASGRPWRGFDPTAKGRHWAVPSKLVAALGIDPDLPQHEKLDALYKRGFIDLNSNYLAQYRQYLADSPGVPLQDVWAYQPYTKGLLRGTDDEIDKDVRWIPDRDKKERVGFPTQKPIGLYSRIILSSTQPGDTVCDPFAGCATTLVAAERLGRQWVGIDIWDNARKVVIERLKKDGKLSTEVARRGEVRYIKTLPVRTDDALPAAPFLLTPKKRPRPRLAPWQKLSRKQIRKELSEAQSVTDGLVLCAGCGRELEAPFMELDHIVPRSDRGENDISNRILLCRPCNGRKSAKLTMKGLVGENKKAGWMKDAKLAVHARDLAQERYEDIRDGRRRLVGDTTPDLFD